LIATMIKRGFWIVAAMVALSAALAVWLPGIAEAQSPDEAATVSTTIPGSNPQVTRVQADTALPQQQQSLYEPAAVRVVNPGDTLWSISEERLQPGATPEQIMNEVDRIYELNRSQIGSNPNLIFAGQEFLLPAVYKPATASAPSGSATVPGEVTGSAVPEQLPRTVGQEQVSGQAVQPQAPKQATQEEQAVPEEAGQDQAAPESNSEQIASSDQPTGKEEAALPTGTEEPAWFHTRDRRMLGLGVMALTLATALLMVQKLPMKRSVGAPWWWRNTGGRYEDPAPIGGSGHLEDVPRPASEVLDAKQGPRSLRLVKTDWGSTNATDSAPGDVRCTHEGPIAVHTHDGQRIAHCLKCGALGPPRSDAPTAREALASREAM
jgi:LysM repeat protein